MKTYKVGIVYWGSTEPFEVWTVQATTFSDACSRLYSRRPTNHLQTFVEVKQ